MPKKYTKTASIAHPKTTLRDATIEDLLAIGPRIKYSTMHFFGEIDLELLFKTAVYTIVLQHEPLEKIAAYANFENFPNISALPKECWTDWIRLHYKMTQCTYGNTLFLTFLVLDDPYNPNLLEDIFREVFLREPKIKFICVVAPPIDSVYEDVLEVHCKRTFSVDSTISRLSQSLYHCEKSTLVPKMRLRRALVEDNDELVEIIDEKLKSVRVELGDFYIAEQVLRQDPSETIIVAEISNVTIGMIWLNSNIQHQVIAENFEITACGHFLRPQQGSAKIRQQTVIDIKNKRSDLFFESSLPGPQRSYLQERQSKLSEQTKMSMVNLYISSEELFEDVNGNGEIDGSPTKVFEMWSRIDKSLKDTYNYIRESEKIVKMPVTTEATNAFAIQLFGLSSTIDPRRIFDLIAAAFSSYPDKDYCIISVPSSTASSDCLSGPLLRYFSHVAPRSECKISDCLYVTHRNSFLSEIQVNFLTQNDVADVENILCFTAAQGREIYNFADILQSITQFLENPWSIFDVFIMRSAGVIIGFAILSQNCAMCELRTNYEVFDSDDYFQDWTSGELNYLYMHPAFNWEWRHVAREIFRLTGYFSMHYKLKRKFSQPILNSLLLKMFPISPRKKLHKPSTETYALYYLNIKLTHQIRTQIENRIIIVGFNEVCKGFLKALIFSPRSKSIQCLNITVITDCPGFIEAEYDIDSSVEQNSMFFNAKNQFNADYLRRLELRTWIRFVAGPLKGIDKDAKRIILANGTSLHYERLFLMCSSRSGAPKSYPTVPVNYLEANSRLDKIIFYYKIRTLAQKILEHPLPILVYGRVAMAHSCVNTLIELGIRATQICLIVPQMTDEMDFPEALHDEHVMSLVYSMETKMGIQIYKGYKIVDWYLHPQENAIESVIFESKFERIAIKCLAFIGFNGDALSHQIRETLRAQNIELVNNRVLIDQHLRTNIPHVYSCGRITQYQETLFAKQSEQRFFNQIEIGKKLAKIFIEERLTGREEFMLESNFTKPIFRQAELIGGLVYAGLRKPGRSVPCEISKNFSSYGHDLITTDGQGEYCRVSLNKNGFVNEITCLTRKYSSLEILFRIYNIHESMLNNMKRRCALGEITSLLDFFHESSFSMIIHDKFKLLRKRIRMRNLECVKDFINDKKKIGRSEIQKYLIDRRMQEHMQKDIFAFIKKHFLSLHPQYALPEDFAN